MKRCPFCAEEIQDEAIKCRHCSEFLDGSRSPRTSSGDDLPWYFRTSTIIFGFLLVGPLALPLLWFHPRCHPAWKVVLSLAIIAFTVWSTIELWRLLADVQKQMQDLGVL